MHIKTQNSAITSSGTSLQVPYVWWRMAGNSVRGRNLPPAVVAVIDCGALICNLILYYSEHTQSKTHPERRMND